MTLLRWNQFGPQIPQKSPFFVRKLSGEYICSTCKREYQNTFIGLLILKMSIFFFLLSLQFFLFEILSVEFWNRFMNFCSLQMQNWNYQIKSKNDISIYKKKKKALFRDLYFHHLIFYFFGIIISNGNLSRVNLANIIT